MTIREKKGVMEVDRQSTRSHCMENSLGKRLWVCRKTPANWGVKVWAGLNWLIVKTCDGTLRTRCKIQVPQLNVKVKQTH
jgi:hypothetical protein